MRELDQVRLGIIDQGNGYGTFPVNPRIGGLLLRSEIDFCHILQQNRTGGNHEVSNLIEVIKFGGDLDKIFLVGLIHISGKGPGLVILGDLILDRCSGDMVGLANIHIKLDLDRFLMTSKNIHPCNPIDIS